MADVIVIKEIATNREHQVDPELRCARVPKEQLGIKKQGADVVRDDGTAVHMQSPDAKFKVSTCELQECKVGEKVFCKAGSSKLGSTFWPMFEVLTGVQPERK